MAAAANGGGSGGGGGDGGGDGGNHALATKRKRARARARLCRSQMDLAIADAFCTSDARLRGRSTLVVFSTQTFSERQPIRLALGARSKLWICSCTRKRSKGGNLRADARARARVWKRALRLPPCRRPQRRRLEMWTRAARAAGDARARLFCLRPLARLCSLERESGNSLAKSARARAQEVWFRSF